MMRSTTAFDDQFILHPDDEPQAQGAVPAVQAQPSEERQRLGKASGDCMTGISRQRY